MRARIYIVSPVWSTQLGGNSIVGFIFYQMFKFVFVILLEHLIKNLVNFIFPHQANN